MKLLRYLGWCCALGLLVAPARAATPVIYEKITAPEFKRILTAEGFTGDADKDGDVVTKMEGQSVLVLIGTNDNTVIQFRFSIRTAATLRQMNDWNREKKFAKAYLDEDGDPTLEMDLDLEGGVTEARIRDSIKTFQIVLEAFLKQLKDK